jgi:hypothetical protein
MKATPILVPLLLGLPGGVLGGDAGLPPLRVLPLGLGGFSFVLLGQIEGAVPTAHEALLSWNFSKRSCKTNKQIAIRKNI